MKKIFLFSIFICFILVITYGYSQQVHNYLNADGIVLEKKIIENPDLLNQYKSYEANLKKLAAEIKNGSIKTDTLINGRKIIPVVFHIIHKYGPENISDEQIKDAVEKLTIDYNKLNSDTSAVFPLFKPRAANCQIEFRLAKIDPDGHCTSGIDRVYDNRTNYAYYSIMHDYAWTPSHYMNIFAVNYIYPEGLTLPEGAFIGGMSPFPPSNTLTQALTGGDTLVDGVLIRQDCIGSIGTATDLGGMGVNLINRTFTHESGHYFNLYHPFQSLFASLGIDGCGMPPLITTGDEVDDTPPVSAATQNTSANCFPPGSRNTCSSTDAIYGGINAPDMVENYMDYQWGYCTNIFTIGQLERINTTMLNDRAKLCSYENLVATGVLDTNVYLCSPKADFSSNYKMICEGSSINFADCSYNGAVSDWEWTFEGGTPSSSTLQNPSVTYNDAGIYKVKLKVSNTSGSDSIVKQNFIIIKDPDAAQDAPFIEGFETNINNWIINNQYGNPWEVSDSAEYSGAHSLRLSNFRNNYPNSLDEIISPSIDFTAFSPVPETLALKFKLAYTGRLTTNPLTNVSDTIWDNLKIFISTDCGKTWLQKYTKTGTSLSTAAPTASSFFPASISDWREDKIMLNQYISNNNFSIKFQFKSGGGNNIYIDDINIVAPNGIGKVELESLLSLNVYPNPMNESANIVFDLIKKDKIKIEILDIVGKVIDIPFNGELNSGRNSIIINKNNIGAAGFYFLKLTVDGKSIIKKIIIN